MQEPGTEDQHPALSRRPPVEWADQLRFRPIQEQDEEFLYRLYASTRAEELAHTEWNDAQKAEFLRMQFQAQHRHYLSHFSRAEFLLILRDGEPIGRLYVERRPAEVRVIDIALLPDWRSRGLGGALMRDLMGDARNQCIPVRLHVEKFNPALRLYERLGFRPVEDLGVHLLMQWDG
jgi:ribosomal protein S18 acetylase RimI-like enzyme